MKRDNWWINRKKTYSNPLLRWRIQCHSKSPKKIGGLTCWQSLRFVIDNMALLRVLFCRCLSIFFGQIHGFPICTNITLNTCLVFFSPSFFKSWFGCTLKLFCFWFHGHWNEFVIHFKCFWWSHYQWRSKSVMFHSNQCNFP